MRFVKTVTPLAFALIAGLVLASVQARADGLDLKAFQGQWQGNGVSQSEVSANFRMTARDLNVSIELQGQGFAVTTTTIQRKKGDPSNPDAVRKSSKREFVPGSSPGVWVAKAYSNPASEQAFTWARIKDQTLTITSVEVDRDGGSNMLIYDRTLSGSGMKLDFRRLVDGYVVRTVSGRLIKFAK